MFNDFSNNAYVFLRTMLITLIIILLYLRVREIISLIKKKRNKQEYIEDLKIGRLTKKDLHKYTPYEFENWCGEFLELMGFTEIEVTPSGNDGGKDICCRKGTEKYFVECKRYGCSKNSQLKIDIEIIRKLIGAMKGENISKGIIITTGYAANEAKDYVRTLPDNCKVSIIDGDELAYQYNVIRDLI